MNKTEAATWGQVPGVIREKLLELCRLMPRDAARRFLQRVLSLLSQELHRRPRAFVWAVFAFAIGELLEDVPVIGWIVPDWAGEVLSVVGWLQGRERDRLCNAILEIHREEIRGQACRTAGAMAT